MKLGTFVVGFCMLAPAALAAAPVPTSLIAGTMMGDTAQANSRYVCYVASGISFFQRPAATASIRNPAVEIGFPSVSVNDAHAGRNSSGAIGLAVMKFTTATLGAASFDSGSKSGEPLGDVPFFDYKQTWTPSTSRLTVSFTLRLPHCDLPIQAIFHGAP
jgi:hypothetical protein